MNGQFINCLLFFFFQRLQELTEEMAKTVHRLLGYEPLTETFLRNADNPLNTKLLLVDEVSMLDIQLINGLLDALPSDAVLILVGDEDQLPSVGPGAVLADVIRSNCFDTVRLTKVFRQKAKNSDIIRVAHNINKGELPDLSKFPLPAKRRHKPAQTTDEDQQHSSDSSSTHSTMTSDGFTAPTLPKKPAGDFYFVEIDTSKGVADTIVDLVGSRLSSPQFNYAYNPTTQIQVLTPMSPGPMGSKNLNAALQKRINPAAPNKREVEAKGNLFRQGDKVMQIINNYDKDVYNGEIGFIKEVRMINKRLLKKQQQMEKDAKHPRRPSRRGGKAGTAAPGSSVASENEELVEDLYEEVEADEGRGGGGGGEIEKRLQTKLPLGVPNKDLVVQVSVEFDRTPTQNGEEGQDRIIKYGPYELDQIVPSYAITVHKSQGNEFPVVVMPVHSDHKKMLQRNIIYTGVTRARQLVVLVGQKGAASYAVGKTRPRLTGLARAIKDAMDSQSK
jgi:ATP-dependent exoDNAse (exonuclease V) alpha subunit